MMPGQPEPRPAQVGKEFQTQQFLIQHADKVVVYITGGEDGRTASSTSWATQGLHRRRCRTSAGGAFRHLIASSNCPKSAPPAVEAWPLALYPVPHGLIPTPTRPVESQAGGAAIGNNH